MKGKLIDDYEQILDNTRGFFAKGSFLNSSLSLKENTFNRKHPLSEKDYRNDFQRDKARIIHSEAFRVMNGKTQVMVNEVQGEWCYRNRLTHSLEVSQISCSIARHLALDEDLTEALALSHDIGHSPFGHVGEFALNEVLLELGREAKSPFLYRFEHNMHAFRILAYLEKSSPDYQGINLTYETLAGILQHNWGRFKNKGEQQNIFLDDSWHRELIFGYSEELLERIKKPSSFEAQLVSVVDDIAYLAHDIEDGLRSKVFSLEQLVKGSTLIEKIAKNLADYDIDENDNLFIKKLLSDLYDNFTIIGILKGLQDSHNRRSNKLEALIELNKEQMMEYKGIKDFLYKNFYENPAVLSITLASKRKLKELFKFYYDNIVVLPNLESQGDKVDISNMTSEDKAKKVVDYLVSLTDNQVISQYRNFF